MKYLRKIVILAIAVVFFAAVALGIGVIFAVRNVNVTIVSYSAEENSEEAKADVSAYKTAILEEVRGSLISFVDADEVAAVIDGGKYSLEECKKVYPCTLNVTLKERKGVFSADGKYYDENGAGMPEGFDFENCVELKGVSGADDVLSVATACKIFKSKFSALNSVVDEVELLKGQVHSLTSGLTYSDDLIFTLRCGLKIELRDYTVRTEEKLSAAFGKFNELSGSQKQKNVIRCSVVNGIVNAEYELYL